MEVNFVRANSGPQISCAPILVGSCSFEKLKNKIKICELENSLGFGPIPRAYFFGRVFFLPASRFAQIGDLKKR